MKERPWARGRHDDERVKVRKDDGDRLSSLARRLQAHAVLRGQRVVKHDTLGPLDDRPRHKWDTLKRPDRPQRTREASSRDVTMDDVDRHFGRGTQAGRGRTHGRRR